MAQTFAPVILGLTQVHFVVCFPITSGVPHSPITTVGWVSDPKGRGTFSLLTSCLATMLLCVWSALHLNIPEAGHNPAKFLLRNIKWMLVGLFGPELVVFSAWRQFNSAKTLQDIVQQIARDRKDSLTNAEGKQETLQHGGPNKADNSHDDQSNWSVVHGFYAAMGGFVFDLDTISASVLSPLSSEPQRLTLTPRGVALLARCGLLPDISKQDIWDKSKADGLTKALVCLQAGWMIIQVLARVVGGLPVSLLEVNTIGHVVCAFTIYVLWWHKPRQIQEPTILRGKWVQPLSAYMWMSSRLSDPRKERGLAVFRPKRVPEMDGLAVQLVEAGGERHLSLSSKESPRADVTNGKSDRKVTIIPEKTSDCTVNLLSEREDEEEPPPFASRCAFKPDYGYMGPVFGVKSSIALAQYSQPPARWRLALDAMQMLPAIQERVCADTKHTRYHWHRLSGEELVTERAGNWSSDPLLKGLRGLVMGMALWFASMAYGAVHAAAWDGYFPSYLEAEMWRSSSLYITASGLLWLCINLFAQLSPSIDNYWESILARRGGTLSYIALGFTCTVCGIAYIFARAFLVVEAVISLRSLPAGIYATPTWSLLIPHL